MYVDVNVSNLNFIILNERNAGHDFIFDSMQVLNFIFIFCILKKLWNVAIFLFESFKEALETFFFSLITEISKNFF